MFAFVFVVGSVDDCPQGFVSFVCKYDRFEQIHGRSKTRNIAKNLHFDLLDVVIMRRNTVSICVVKQIHLN